MEVVKRNKITWEVRDEIGFVHFIDPPENRMDAIFFHELKELTTEIIPKFEVKAILISGYQRHFSAGADLDDLIKMINIEKNDSDTLLANYQSFRFFWELKIPVIATIKGVCIGSAMELALFCHFRICSEDAIFGLPESTFGLMPGVGGIPKTMVLAGKAKTIELVLKGNTFNAKDALNWNIVDAVFSKKTLMEKAIQLAELSLDNYRKYNKPAYLKSLKMPG